MFLDALDRCDLDELLRQKGPYTVFAPNDDAFARLGDGVMDHLMHPDNREKLRKILCMHIVGGLVQGTDLAKKKTLKTIDGRSIRLGTTGESTSGNTPASSHMTIGPARIIGTDIACSNGVIHVIDTVILLP